MTQRDDDPEAAVAALRADAPAAHAEHVDCRQLAQMLGEYVDDQLPSAVKSAVDAHMAQCAPCVAFLRQYRFAPETARRVLLKAVPPELENRVLSFLRGRCKKD